MGKLTSHAKILVIEDNEVEIAILRSALEQVGEVSAARSVAEAEQALQSQTFSLIVTDINLPDGDGFQLLERIRSERKTMDTPVFLITGRTSIEDRIIGFNLGADDYIVKPFEPEELSARVKRKLLRQAATGPQTSMVRAQFHVDFLTQKISRIAGDGSRAQLNVTPIEGKLLIHFLQHEGQIFSRHDLINKIWGETTHVSDHTVDTHISSLRKKMGDSAQHLKAIVKKGYCFDSENKIKA